MMGVSVIVCCYNSEKRLPETLQHLARQRVQEGFPWEVILVNNNSSDQTVSLAKSVWETIGAPAPLVVVEEPQPGLSFAREKGLSRANFEVLLWCDDDNWLCDSYVQTAFDLMEEHPHIGALGGWCEPVFESEKPVWFDTYARYFAVAKQGRRSGDITHKKGCVYGAGMVTRKSHNAQLKELGFSQLLKGRTGKKLSSGEDTEYCYALRLLGYKIWYEERLYFKHFITDGRLSLTYVSRLRKAMAHSNFMLWAYLDSLNGSHQSRLDFLRAAFRGMPLTMLKKTGALVVGSFEQRETAKRYFRNLGYRLFSYATYKRNMEILNSWKP